jgi:hypothetical protein
MGPPSSTPPFGFTPYSLGSLLGGPWGPEVERSSLTTCTPAARADLWLSLEAACNICSFFGGVGPPDVPVIRGAAVPWTSRSKGSGGRQSPGMVGVLGVRGGRQPLPGKFDLRPCPVAVTVSLEGCQAGGPLWRVAPCDS